MIKENVRLSNYIFNTESRLNLLLGLIQRNKENWGTMTEDVVSGDTIPLRDVAFKISNIQIIDGFLFGDIETTDTPKGKVLECLHNNNIDVKYSLVGLQMNNEMYHLSHFNVIIKPNNVLDISKEFLISSEDAQAYINIIKKKEYRDDFIMIFFNTMKITPTFAHTLFKYLIENNIKFDVLGLSSIHEEIVKLEIKEIRDTLSKKNYVYGKEDKAFNVVDIDEDKFEEEIAWQGDVYEYKDLKFDIRTDTGGDYECYWKYFLTIYNTKDTRYYKISTISYSQYTTNEVFDNDVRILINLFNKNRVTFTKGGVVITDESGKIVKCYGEDV